MQEAQGAIKDVHQHLPSRILGLLVLAVEPDLRYLDEPIAILTPQEVVDLPSGLAELPVLHEAGHVPDQAVVATQYPAIGQRPIGIWDLVIGHLREHEAGRIPHLIGKVAVGLHAGEREVNVVAGSGAGEEGEAQGVTAVLVYDLQRIYHVVLGAAHLLTVFVPHHPVQVDVVEWDVASTLQPHHDHPRHPEEQDVVAGLEDGGGVEVAQILGVVGPAQGGKGP